MISLPAQAALVASLSALAGSVLLFLAVGLAHDLIRWRSARKADRVHDDLAIIVLGSEDEAALAAERLSHHRPAAVLSLVQRLSADITGDGAVRLRQLVGATGLDRRIRRRMRSRSWRRRAQGAALASLLPSHDPRRTALLDDPHPLVRARAAEGVDPQLASRCADRLVELLDDDVDAVKFAAQRALLQSGTAPLDALRAYLETSDSTGVEWALEVAANVNDPRLVDSIRRHLDAPEPVRRAIATRAIAPWLSDLADLDARLDDDHPTVRATAAEAAGQIGAEALAPRVGRLLGDRSWLVRERAGAALADMGPMGVLTLRLHLDDEDPYAQDMARQVLDTLDANRADTTGAAA